MKWLISLCLLFCVFTVGAQEWSEPLLISSIPGPDTYPDFCIDSNGVLHCVWSHIYNVVDHKTVFYSKSSDNGNTWTEPIRVSADSIAVAVVPKIRCDSQNNLYIAYSYGSGYEDSYVHFRKFDGNGWSEIIDIGGDYNQISVVDMVVDNSNRVYVFMYFGGIYGYSLYRYLDHNTWSDLHVLHDTESFNNTVYSVKCDVYNNLHCLSIFRPVGQNYYTNRAAYTFFDCSLNYWNSPIVLGTAYSPSGSGLGEISLDNFQNPSLTWRQDENCGTAYYSALEESIWQGPYTIADSLYDIRSAVDSQNCKHWIGVIRNFIAPYSWTYNLVYIDELSNTQTTLTDFSYGTFNPKLLYRDNRLYLLFSGSNVNGQPEVYVIKKDIPVSVIDDTDLNGNHDVPLICLHPNPAKQKVNIEFQTNSQTHLDIDVFNQRGQRIKTIYSGSFLPGQHNLTWDGTDNNSQRIAKGIYILRLRSETGQHIRKILFEK